MNICFAWVQRLFEMLQQLVITKAKFSIYSSALQTVTALSSFSSLSTWSWS